MATNKALEMAGNMFNYENPRCDCKVTTNYTDDGIEYHSLQIKPIEGFYNYAYAPIDGLVMIDKKTGTVIEKYKVVEDFLNVDLTKADKIKEHIDTYGFIMQLPADGKYRIFNHLDIGHLIKRFRVLVKLMAAIEDEDIDYDSVLKLTAYLLFSIPRQLTINQNEEGLCSCVHTFTHFWFNVGNLPDLTGNLVNSHTNDPYDDYYPINDTFTKQTEHLGVVDFHFEVEDVDLSEASSPYVFKTKMMKLYRDAFSDGTDTNLRYTVDFLYHLLKIGVEIDDVLENGEIHTNVELNKYDKFDDTFKSHLILIVKNTIKAEFDFALYGIHPTYSVETMSPNWKISNFFTALYFSLFYTRPDYEVYRKCANPNCNRLFKVKTTNSRKQYHDISCQNATAQMRHRKAKK